VGAGVLGEGNLLGVEIDDQVVGTGVFECEFAGCKRGYLKSLDVKLTMRSGFSRERARRVFNRMVPASRSDWQVTTNSRMRAAGIIRFMYILNKGVWI
jgi:hypothetical protein